MRKFYTALGWIGAGIIAFANALNGNHDAAVWTMIATIVGYLFSIEKRLSRIETLLQRGESR